MAHSKQALKRARQNERLRVEEPAMRSDMKTHLKALDAAIAAKDQKAVAALARDHAEQGGQGREAPRACIRTPRRASSRASPACRAAPPKAK